VAWRSANEPAWWCLNYHLKHSTEVGSRKPHRLQGFLGAGVILFCGLASANTVNFSGTFSQDDNVEFFSLVLNSPGSVVIKTLSFASSDGFVPVLSLFDGIGSEITANIGSANPCNGNTMQDPISNLCWDAYLATPLNAGSYTLALTEDNNTAAGPTLGDGFSQTGQGNFTGPTFLGSPGQFIAVDGSQRSWYWALEITGFDSAVQTPIEAAPEPKLLALALISFLIMIAIHRKVTSRALKSIEATRKDQT
jgi:hypothetical protein